MKKIALIGDKDSVLPFRLFDFSIYVENEPANIPPLIEQLVEENVEIIFLTEKLAVGNEKVFAKYEEKISPAILLLPNIEGSLGIGREKIQKGVERAVGQNIL